MIVQRERRSPWYKPREDHPRRLQRRSKPGEITSSPRAGYSEANYLRVANHIKGRRARNQGQGRRPHRDHRAASGHPGDLPSAPVLSSPEPQFVRASQLHTEQGCHTGGRTSDGSVLGPLHRSESEGRCPPLAAAVSRPGRSPAGL